ncbi:hypothetical protein [Streptomyces sp. SudanB5_2050]|uniref:hypothetical protein n=1 Tax=Streptomyces sp. SudanB5_2050 TaxID=3035274 RepID=UPI0036DD8333
MPEDPAEQPAAVDIATRQRRVLSVQSRRWVWWLLGAAALLWLANAVARLLLINPLSMRRQRRRLEAVEHALHVQGTPRAPSAS